MHTKKYIQELEKRMAVMALENKELKKKVLEYD